jgi:hypothetical protein
VGINLDALFEVEASRPRFSLTLLQIAGTTDAVEHALGAGDVLPETSEQDYEDEVPNDPLDEVEELQGVRCQVM